jgi:hypothetical protein
VDESGRACPCLTDYVCCVDTCVPAAEGCASASDAGPADTGAEAGLDAPGSDALARDAPNAPDSFDAFDAPAPDAAPAEASGPDGAMACMALPKPLVHFAFSDCSTAGFVHDTAGGATGVFEGSGILCDQSPVGGALRFGRGDDAGAGSYVRVVDALDAGTPVCGDTGCPPGWPFAGAITVSALLDVANTGNYENILGQWYSPDSYIFNTYYDMTHAQQVLRFTVQPTGGGQPVDLTAPVPVPSGSSLHAWSHWVGVFDGASASLYQDGRLVATTTLTYDAAANLQCTNVPLELGVIGQDAPCGGLDQYYFTGAIGDVQIFNVALDPDQVKALECSLGWPTATADAGM